MSTEIIIEKESQFSLTSVKEVFEYKDLIGIFVYRDFIAQYKQTILGPLWFILQPIVSSVVFYEIFFNIAKIQVEEGIHPFLFYFSGLICWGYISDSFVKTSSSLIDNRAMFSKVYFPRLVVPISISLSNFLKLCLQIMIFYVFYFVLSEFQISVFKQILMLPIIAINMLFLGCGGGLIFSSFTLRYRDLHFLLAFGVQLLMYMSPVIYKLDVATSKYGNWLQFNPLVPLINNFRDCLTGNPLDWYGMAYSFVFALILFCIGMVIFNKAQNRFMDLA